jgi:phage-related protein (TIGR01555 family)
LSLWSSYGVPVRDTLFNLLSGLGTAKDPRTSARFVFRELRRDQVENMYRGDWLARRLVDLPAEDATREWRTWQADPKKIDAIEKLEKKFELQKKTRQALQRARLYGGAALVIGVDQGDPSEELDYERVGKDDLKFVVVLNKYELTPGPRIYDVDSRYYTRPSYYQVATPTRRNAQICHFSTTRKCRRS